MAYTYETVGRLDAHRKALLANPNRFTQDIERCSVSIEKMVRDAGYRVTKELRPLINKLVAMIFAAQDNEPFFHFEVEDEMVAWNSPAYGGWDVDFIKYEWGHLESFNTIGADAFRLDNLAPMSARCNQHIQAALDYRTVGKIFAGSKLESTIERRIKARAAMVASKEWQDLMAEFDKFKKA